MPIASAVAEDKSLPTNRDPDTKFFHRKHVIATFWAIVASLLTFVATTYWQIRQGPQRVYVTNPDTTVRIATGHDSALTRRIDELSGEVHSLRTAAARAPEVVVPGLDQLPATNPVQSPSFRFPSQVQGYIADNVETLALSRCPRGPFQAGGEIPVHMKLKNASTASRLTPLMVSLTRESGPHSLTQVWAGQFEPRVDNFVLAPAPRDSGSYELDAGFYLLSDLNTKYPPFYRLSCKINVAG